MSEWTSGQTNRKNPSRQKKVTYYVIPPPALPKPPAKEFALPTMFLSKNPVHHTWQGTNVAPRMPTKNRNAIRPLGVKTRPAKTVGMAPQSSNPTKTKRGPYRSHSGPQKSLTRSLGCRSRLVYRAYKFALFKKVLTLLEEQ